MGSDTTHLLMDVGISRKRTVDALHDLDLDLRDIDGIFITHEHADHISGLPMIAKKSQMPIYATRGTIEAILRSDKCKEIDPERFVAIRPDEKITVKDITDNCGYSTATFYRQFKDKYDLIAWQYSRSIGEIMDRIGVDDNGWKQILLDGAVNYQANKDYLSNLLLHTSGMIPFSLI